jgi:hypothetical protein
VYFGTRNGWLYGSRDEGESWSVIEENLPPVTCVRAIGVRGLRKARPARRRKAA